MIPELQKFIFNELVFTDKPENFGHDQDLLEAGLDSMGIMRLVLFVEEKFGVTLPDEEIEPDNVRTLNALAHWIQRHKNG